MRYWAIVGCREKLDFEEWKKLVENEGQVLEEQYNSYINDLEKFTAKSEYYRKELEAKQAEEDYLKKKHPVLWALKKGALGAAGVVVAAAGFVTAPIWLPPVLVSKVIDDE